jgi:hypothetical protein
MKLFLKIFIFLILLFIGCSENQNITSPIDDVKFEKITDPNDPNYLNAEEATILLDYDPPVWISLPILPSITPGANYNTSKMIYNDKDDKIEIDTTYEGGIFDEVRFELTLKFDKEIMQQDSMCVTVEIDLQNGSLKFGPAAIFKEPVMMDYKIKGLDFSLFDPYDVTFIYAGLNGVIEPILFYKYEVKESEGSIKIQKGELSHFSRYGFVRRNVGH